MVDRNHMAMSCYSIFKLEKSIDQNLKLFIPSGITLISVQTESYVTDKVLVNTERHRSPALTCHQTDTYLFNFPKQNLRKILTTNGHYNFLSLHTITLLLNS